MAIIYGKNTAVDYAAGNLASFGKSYSRMGAAPLDMYEVWYDLAELQKYASFRGNDANGNPVYNGETEVVDTSAVTSYVGQKVAYVDDANGKIYHYSIELDGSLKEIGTSPIGDEKSIVVASDGTVSLKGVADLTFSREVDILGEDGQPTGEKTTEDVTYQALMTKDGLVWVEPSKTTVEGLATLIDALTVRVKANEDAIGVASKPESSEGAGDAVAATGLHKKIEDEVARATAAENALDGRVATLEGKEDKDTTYSVKEEEKVLSLDGTAFGTTLKLDYSDNKIKLLGINDVLISEFDASAFVADGVLEDASYNAEDKTITFTWNIETGKDEDGNPVYKTDVIDIGDLVDTYTAGNGLNLDSSNEFTVKVAEGDKYLTVDGTGVHTKEIDNAIATAKQEAIDIAAGDATTKANAAKDAAITDAASKYYGKGETYTKTEIDDLLEGIQGGASESAASVNTKLEAYKKVVNAEVWGDEAGQGTDGNSRIDILESKVKNLEDVEAQANVIENVVVNNGSGEGIPAAKLTAALNTENKTVTLNDVALQSAIADAKQAGVDAASVASTAQAAAETAQSAAETANAKAVKNADDIKALQEADTTANGKITNLETAVNNETSGLAATYAKASRNESDITALKAKDAAHDKDVADLKASDLAQNEKITEIETTLTNVYTKDQVNAITGTPTTGKTLVQMIEDSQKATQDAIDNLYKVPSGSGGANTEGEKPTGTLAEVIAGLEKSISDEVARSTEIDDDHEERIAKMEVFWKAVDSTDEGESNVINKLEEIVNYIESDKSGAADMVASVQANTEAIEKIYKETTSEETGEVTKSGVLVDLISEAVSDIPVATDTILGLVMGSSAENKVAVAADGTMSVNSLNVNKLVQTDGEFLVLNGGGASV